MPARDEIHEDLVDSLSQYFPLDPERGIRNDRPGAEDGDLIPFEDAMVLANGSTSAAAWQYNGIDSIGVNGLAPTGLPIVIRGVTVHDPEANEGRGAFLRYVDWLDVYSQLGLTMIARTGIEPPPEP